jgi:hypothetical protein
MLLADLSAFLINPWQSKPEEKPLAVGGPEFFLLPILLVCILLILENTVGNTDPYGETLKTSSPRRSTEQPWEV